MTNKKQKGGTISHELVHKIDKRDKKAHKRDKLKPWEVKEKKLKPMPDPSEGGTGIKLDPGPDGVYNTDDDPGSTNPGYRKTEKTAKTSGKTSFTFNGKTYKVKKKLVHVPKRGKDGKMTVEKQMLKKGGCKKCGGMYQEGGFLLPPIEEL